MSIEAMKQALEALECLFGMPEHLTGKGGGDVSVWRLGGSYRAQQAIPSLRQAIAEAEKQEPVAWWIPKAEQFCLPSSDGTRPFAKAWEPLYTTPPQRTWVGLPESAFAGMTLQQVTAMKYAEQILKDQNT